MFAIISALPQSEKFNEAKAVCNCILNACAANASNTEAQVTFNQYLLPQCLWLAVHGALHPSANILTHKDIVELLASIMRCVVQALPTAR